MIGPTSVAPGGVSGKYDVAFPPRNESFDFRNQLETLYRASLGRAAAPTSVDQEGEVVWTQEYMRYRTNGCDHATAVARVMAQIDGQPAGGVCGAPPEGLIEFPPRPDSLDLRRQLEAKYLTFNRGLSQSSVDPEGGVVWTQEYLRYRVNACDHPTAVQKVFTQINGGGVQPTCFVPPCLFTVAPFAQNFSPAGGTSTAIITKTQGENCSYVAESLAPWVSIGTGGTGTDTTTLTYAVAPNPGAPRATQIRVRWTNNSVLLQITQAGNNSGLTLTDPLASPATTTNCMIKTAATPCVLTATGAVVGTPTYTWAASYNYGGPITHTQSGSSPTFTFNQMCGGPGSSPTGTTSALEVTLTVTDDTGSYTLQAGQNGLAAFTIQFFTCS